MALRPQLLRGEGYLVPGWLPRARTVGLLRYLCFPTGQPRQVFRVVDAALGPGAHIGAVALDCAAGGSGEQIGGERRRGLGLLFPAPDRR